MLSVEPSPPCTLIVMGCSMGNIFGLPRGGTFHFLWQWFTLAVTTWFLFWVGHLLFKSFMASGRRIYWGPKGPTTEPPEAEAAAEHEGEHVHDETTLVEREAADAYGRGPTPLPGAG